MIRMLSRCAGLLMLGGCAHSIALQNASPFHEDHAGDVVFATSPVRVNREEPGAFKDAFTYGEPFYGAYYLKEEPEELARENDLSFVNSGGFGLVLRAVADGKVISEMPIQPVSSSAIGLVRSRGEARDWQGVPRWFSDRVVRQLSPGAHTLQLAVLIVPPPGIRHSSDPRLSRFADAEEVVAHGKVTFTVPPNAPQLIAGILANEGPAERMARENAAAEEARQEQAARAWEQMAQPPQRQEGPRARPSVVKCPPDYLTTPECCGARITPEGQCCYVDSPDPNECR